jgi:hypothetical protein
MGNVLGNLCLLSDEMHITAALSEKLRLGFKYFVFPAPV